MKQEGTLRNFWLLTKKFRFRVRDTEIEVVRVQGEVLYGFRMKNPEKNRME